MLCFPGKKRRSTFFFGIQIVCSRNCVKSKEKKQPNPICVQHVSRNLVFSGNKVVVER